MRLLLLFLTGASLAGCTHDAADGPLDTPPALTHSPLAPDSRRPDSLSLDSLTGTFEGHYSAGFEHTGFAPCADTTEAWWTEPGLEFAGAPVLPESYADVGARYERLFGPDDRTRPSEGPVVWARLRGRATPRRDGTAGMGYGHLGAYSRKLVVDSVEVLVRDTVVAGCPAPASVRP